MKNTRTQLIRLLVLIPLSLLLMGNHSCEEDSRLLRVPEGERHLKPTIEVGYIESENIIYSDGRVFDFEWAANHQLQENITKSQLFFVPSPRPNASTGRAISESDENLITNWSYEYSGRPYDSTRDAACLIDRPQVRIDGEIRSLELVSKFNMSIGFGGGVIGSPTAGLGAGIYVEKGVLELGLHAHDALRGTPIAATHSETIRVKRQINATIPIGALPLGISYYFQSRFAWLTNEAIVTALNDLIVGLAKHYEFSDHYKKWFTRVIEDRGSHVVINAGSYNGLKEGDILEVYNEDHFWAGAPCASQYRDSLRDPRDLAAVIKIVSTGAIVALGEVVEYGSAQTSIGAKVVLKEFAPEPEPYEP